jgi:single-strand DNA-binding protein
MSVEPLNLVVLSGVLARPPQVVELPSGSRVASFEVTVRRSEGAAEVVPVSWMDAPSWASVLEVGTGVVVTGRVRRRFFKAGGATQSRTEVVASRMVRSTSRAKVRVLMAQAEDSLQDLDPRRTPPPT